MASCCQESRITQHFNQMLSTWFLWPWTNGYVSTSIGPCNNSVQNGSTYVWERSWWDPAHLHKSSTSEKEKKHALLSAYSMKISSLLRKFCNSNSLRSSLKIYTSYVPLKLTGDIWVEDGEEKRCQWIQELSSYHWLEIRGHFGRNSNSLAVQLPFRK